MLRSLEYSAERHQYHTCEQKKIMKEQKAEIKQVAKAVDTQTAVLQKNAGG